MDQTQLQTLSTCPLFEGVTGEELPAALECLGAKTRKYAKNEAIFPPGSAVTHMGIVLAGSVRVEQDDYWGNRTILAQLSPAELFGEAFLCAGIQRLPVGVYAAAPAAVLLADYRKIVSGCPSGCGFHARLVQNMLGILAQKNVALTWKIEAVTQRTTRDKLLSYLSRQARQQGENPFIIPFNRQELADYLSVDRSAMSAELSRMQRDGLLRTRGNQFELMQKSSI